MVLSRLQKVYIQYLHCSRKSLHDEETINEVNGLSPAIIGVYFYVLHFVKDDSLSLKVCV